MLVEFENVRRDRYSAYKGRESDVEVLKRPADTVVVCLSRESSFKSRRGLVLLRP